MWFWCGEYILGIKAKFGVVFSFDLLKEKLFCMEKYKFKNHVWEIKNYNILR